MAEEKKVPVRDVIAELEAMLPPGKRLRRPKWFSLKKATREEYPGIVAFFIENGLEFDMEDEVETDLVACYKLVTGQSGRAADLVGEHADQEKEILVGACCLAKRQGCYIVDGIAVDPEYRDHKYGKLMLDKLVKLTKAEGGDALYLVARAPGFFRKYGFVQVSQEEAPLFYECASCPQFGTECHPEIMKYTIPA